MITLPRTLRFRADDKGEPGGSKPKSEKPGATADDYRKLLVDARRQQLRVSLDNVQMLEGIFDRAAANIQAAILKLPDEAEARKAYLTTLLADIQEVLHQLAKPTATLTGGIVEGDLPTALNLSLLEVAQQAADTQKRTADLVNAPTDRRLLPTSEQTVTLADETRITVKFGSLATNAVERAALRLMGDPPLRLSDRLYNLATGLEKTVGETIVQGIVEQVSAKALAKRMETALSEAGADNPRYQALRIARTEINNAHREAAVQSALDPTTRELKDYIAGFRWNLSLSHKVQDVCDLWAAGGSEGLPEGVYLPADVPVDHPHGLCHITTELVDLPGVSGPGKAPDTEAVPTSQIRYYASKGDPVAQRFLDQREAQ